jgi:hypothetical protein
MTRPELAVDNAEQYACDVSCSSVDANLGVSLAIDGSGPKPATNIWLGGDLAQNTIQ